MKLHPHISMETGIFREGGQPPAASCRRLHDRLGKTSPLLPTAVMSVAIIEATRNCRDLAAAIPSGFGGTNSGASR
jgi:hypothetical protein